MARVNQEASVWTDFFQSYVAVFICKVDLLLGWTVFLFISDVYTRECNQEISIDCSQAI